MKKSIYKKLNKNSAFTLVEMMVAVAIFSASITAVLTLSGGGVANINYAQSKMSAIYLAQEGIESIRNMRDSYVLSSVSTGWTSFRTKIITCTSSSKCGVNLALAYNNPNYVYACSGTNCNLYLNNGNYNVTGLGTETGFTRRVWADSSAGTNEVKIYSAVSFNVGVASYSVTFSETLFNWIE